MKSLLFAAGFAAFATPALAQMTEPAPSTPTSPATTSPSVASPAPAPGAGPAQDSAAQAAAAPADPKTIIASEFPAYDKDASGALSKVEFDTWLVALKEKSGDATMKTADQTSWLKKAFATADKDKTKDVSLAELTDYLTAAS